MRVRPQYLIAAVVAIVAIAVYAVVPKGSSGPQLVSAKQAQAMQQAALRRLRLPTDFKRTSSNCQIGTCYFASVPAAQVEGLVPRLMRSAGMQPLGSLRTAEPLAQLQAAHWSTATHDPLVIACKPVSTSSAGSLETCQDAARIGPTVVNVLVRPPVTCQKRACDHLGETEVITWSATIGTN